MRRRRLLATIAAASLPVAAGCNDPRSSSETTRGAPAEKTESETDTETPSSTPDAGRDPETFPEKRPDWRQVIHAETTPRAYALSAQHYRTPDDAAVTVGFTATATANHPARLAVFLRNANDFANTFRLRESPIPVTTVREPRERDEPEAVGESTAT
ncbi:hypothetical protein [Halogeometricum limi]|uniref:Uncharacterized protein n=1 Tax=Halogeometricum limi TaxID=555875 RepID=A0A1I6G273_9EURY|nr:hypothetical protein [Halogeometricum limi]SFR36278.1 hypothetical protein SAMN04488124_0748 [Halogeometricum limi]